MNDLPQSSTEKIRADKLFILTKMSGAVISDIFE